MCPKRFNVCIDNDNTLYYHSMTTQLDFKFDRNKSELLKRTRGIGFEDVVEAVKEGALVKDVAHPNRIKYPHQRMLVVKIGGYIYAAPYVEKKGNKAFLKTLYPNRKLNKIYGKK